MEAERFGVMNEPASGWRRLECWGAGLCLFLQAGAMFPLALSDADGSLSASSRATLRLLALPVYAFTALILFRNLPQFLVALRRNLLVPLLLTLPFLSILWSVYPSTTTQRAVALLFTVLLAYVLAIRFSPRQLMVIVLATFGLCMILSVVFLVAAPGIARTASDGTLRGIFLSKNILGWYACITVMVATVVLFDGSMGLRRTACLLLVVSGFCLLSSGSMTATIATVTALFLIGFYSMLRRSRGAGRVVIIFLAIQFAVGLLILLHGYLVPFLEALGKDATLTGRVPLWQLVDRQIADHLLLGFGYQTFWTERNLLAWDIWSEIGWLAPHAHNGFRDTLLSFGVTGTALFVLMLLRTLREGAVLHCRDPNYGWLWLNVLTGMVLVMNLTESIFLVQNDAIFILFATGMIMFSLYGPAVAPETSQAGPAAWRNEPAEIRPS